MRICAEDIKMLVDKIYQGEKYLNREEFIQYSELS